MNRLANLYRLQEVDIALESAARQVQAIRNQLADNREVETATLELQAREEVLSARKVVQDGLEQEISGVGAKSRQAEQRLYSGLVKSPKELSDLELEFQAHKRRIDVLEEQLLEVLIEVDEMADDVQQLSNRRESLTASKTEADRKLGNEHQHLMSELAKLTGRRSSIVEGLDGELLDRYDRLRKRKGGIAVAAVDNGSCQICHVIASTTKVSAVRHGELVTCGSCGRLFAQK